MAIGILRGPPALLVRRFSEVICLMQVVTIGIDSTTAVKVQPQCCLTKWVASDSADIHHQEVRENLKNDPDGQRLYEQLKKRNKAIDRVILENRFVGPGGQELQKSPQTVAIIKLVSDTWLPNE